MGWSILATAALASHFVYVAYVVLGGFLAWRWPKVIVPHLVAAAWGALIVFGLVECPLTWLEDTARERAGGVRPTIGFVDRYLEGVIYPARFLDEVRVGVAVLIGLSWLGAYAFWRARRGPRRHPAGPDADTRSKSDTEDGRAATV